MPDAANDDDIRKWHRFFAVECNNASWSLAEAASRSIEEDRDMLDAAHAAAFHWSKVGTEIHRARADMLLAHVHALLGHGAIALQYARASFDAVTSRESPDWEVAFAHAVLAHAGSATNDGDLHARHHALAKKMGLALPDAEERAIFEATFCRIPVPAASNGGVAMDR